MLFFYFHASIKDAAYSYLKLINYSSGKHKGNQHQDGVWICNETLA